MILLLLLGVVITFLIMDKYYSSNITHKRNANIEKKIDSLNEGISTYKAEIEKLNNLILANDIGLNSETKIYNYKVTQIKEQPTSEDVKQILHYIHGHFPADTVR